MSELFPEIAQAARQARRERQAFKRAVARQKMERFPPEWPPFVLRQLRERGPSTGQAVYDGLEEIGMSGQADGETFYFCAMRLHALMFVMADAGILWRHDFDEEIAAFGIRGEQNKADYLRAEAAGIINVRE